MRFSVLLIIIFALVSPPGSAGDEFTHLESEDIEWQASRFAGLSYAIISGNPKQAGLYILRARFSPGKFSPPHFHSTDRHVTVLKGTWWVGKGEVFNRSVLIPVAAGGYMKHPANAVHYDGALDEEAIVEIKGIGPVETTLVGEMQE